MIERDSRRKSIIKNKVRKITDIAARRSSFFGCLCNKIIDQDI